MCCIVHDHCLHMCNDFIIHTHTRTHARTHTLTHSHTLAYTPTYVHTYIYIHTVVCTHLDVAHCLSCDFIGFVKSHSRISRPVSEG